MGLISIIRERIGSSVRTKIIAVGLVAAILPVLLMLIVTGVERTKLSNQIGGELDQTLRTNLSDTAMGVRRVCETQDATLKEALRGDLNVARDVVQRSGGVRILSDNVSWTAKNQLTEATTQVSLPKVAIGSSWLGQNTNKDTREPAVDEVAKLVGSVCTVFQRMNAKGDMLRIATNVLKKNGTRAIGTYIPSVNPDGTPNPVVSSVMQGSTYVGRAFVVDAWYLSAYEPIKDSAGKVIGMLFVGLKQDGLSNVQKAVHATTIGKSGYTFVLQGTGEAKGTYVISKGGQRDGENIWDSKDADGKYVIQSMINDSMKAGGKTIISRYPWQNKGESKPRMKLAAITYYAPWDWVVGVSAYEDEFQGARNQASASINRLVMTAILAGLIASIVTVLLTVKVGTGVSTPLAGAVSVLKDIAEGEGDLTKRLEVSQKDEVGQLCGWFNKFMDNLHSIIAQTSDSANEVTDSSQELSKITDEIRQSTKLVASKMERVAAGSKDQSKTVQSSSIAIDQLSRAIAEVAQGAQNQASTVETTVVLIQQIAESIETLTKLSREAASSSRQVSEVATSGGSQVSRTVEGMDRIKGATDRVAEMVARLGESSQQIGAIVEIIDDIADQTNLLALNAAIEAARAGEHGKGFAVVADEVRKLAERSSTSTAEIAELIHGIQEITQSAVLAMAEGSKEVADGSQLATEAGKALSGIQQAVAGIVAQIESMLTATEQMNASSVEVMKAVESVSAITEQTTAAAQEMNASSSEVANQIEQVAAVSEDNAAVAEEVSAATQDQSGAIMTLANSAEELSSMAEQLQSLVSRFKLGEREEEPEPELRKPHIRAA